MKNTNRIIQYVGIVILCLLARPVAHGQLVFKNLAQKFPAYSQKHATTISRSLTKAVVNSQLARSSQEKQPKLSYSLQKKEALALRPYLFQTSWKTTPRQAAPFSDEITCVRERGNLTQMNHIQFARATKIYQQAMQHVQALARQVDAKIYYLATPEAENLTPPEINQTLGKIEQTRQFVLQAQSYWGDDPVLKQATVYLKKLRAFYILLATGSYPLEQETPLARSDGHVYVKGEFGLWSEQIPEKIPTWDWKDPFSWFSNARYGALPANQRVALLQDDPEVIEGFKRMRSQAGLTGWKIDVYDDPEFFLNQIPYQQYDLILTDVLIKNGGGRYLARQLRSLGFEGPILTVSGFSVIHGGEVFFADGIDGMMTLLFTPQDYPGHFWSQLNNYFILKEKYGWKH